jgi:hypothetical protein
MLEWEAGVNSYAPLHLRLDYSVSGLLESLPRLVTIINIITTPHPLPQPRIRVITRDFLQPSKFRLNSN